MQHALPNPTSVATFVLACSRGGVFGMDRLFYRPLAHSVATSAVQLYQRGRGVPAGAFRNSGMMGVDMAITEGFN